MEGIYFLGGLFLIVWLAYWVAQEGREPPGTKRHWSPFEWIDEVEPPTSPVQAPRAAGSWRDRARQPESRRPSSGIRR